MWKSLGILLLSILFYACGTSKLASAETETETASDQIETASEKVEENIPDKVVEYDYSNEDTLLIWVGSQLDTLPSGANELGLLTQVGTKYPALEGWECIHKRINGFIFEPGYICQLKVKVEKIEGKPQLRMVELVTKMIDMDYYRVNDIWALTHLNTEVLEISTQRPNMEINLKLMRFMGNGSCNNYMGKIEQYNSTHIKLGAIAGTKMMCESISLEQKFYEALTNTRKYQVKNTVLIFSDASGKELLRFKKVD